MLFQTVSFSGSCESSGGFLEEELSDLQYTPCSRGRGWSDWCGEPLSRSTHVECFRINGCVSATLMSLCATQPWHTCMP